MALSWPCFLHIKEGTALEAKIFGIGADTNRPVRAANAGLCSYLLATHCCCSISLSLDHMVKVGILAFFSYLSKIG